MKASIALIWKEWREVRGSLFAWSLIFIGIPLYFALCLKNIDNVYYTSFGSLIATSLGAICAIFVAAGLTCPDLRPKLIDFSLSKPINISKWIAIKYFAGLSVVIFVYLSAFVIDYFSISSRVYETSEPVRRGIAGLYCLMNTHTFTIILIYSLSFFIGCVVRKTAYAAIFSIAMALLIYFLPLLVPILGSFSVFNLMEQWPVQSVHLSRLESGGPWFGEKLRILKLSGDFGIRYNIEWLRYVVVAVVSIALSVIFSALAVKKNWRLKIGQKSVLWSFGVVGLLLLSGLAFQVGSNLKCIRKISLKPVLEEKGYLVQIFPSGDKGLLIFGEVLGEFGNGPGISISQYDLSNESKHISPAIRLESDAGSQWRNWPVKYRSILWSEENPDLIYYIKREVDPNTSKYTFYFCTAFLDEEAGKASVTHKLNVGPLRSKNTLDSYEYMTLKNDKAYVSLFEKLIIIDLSIPSRPTLSKIIDGTLGYAGSSYSFDSELGRNRSLIHLNMIPADSLSIEERLEITVALTSPHWISRSSPYIMAASDKKVVLAAKEFVRVYEFKGMEGDVAILEMTAQRLPTPLEQYLRWNPQYMFISDGLSYVFDTRGGSSITVFDISKSGTVKRVGHYASAGGRMQTIAPLQDKGVLVGMRDKLQIVAPPN